MLCRLKLETFRREMQILCLGLLGIIPRQILPFQSWTVTYTAVLLTHSCTHSVEILYRAACVYICHCPSLLWTICHLTSRLQDLRDFKAHICHNTEWKKTVNDRSSSDQWFRAEVSKTYFLFWIVPDCSGRQRRHQHFSLFFGLDELWHCRWFPQMFPRLDVRTRCP